MKAMSSRDQMEGLHVRNLCIYYCVSLWHPAEVISSLCSGSNLSWITFVTRLFKNLLESAKLSSIESWACKNCSLLGNTFVRHGEVRSSHDEILWSFSLVRQEDQKKGYFRLSRSTKEDPKICGAPESVNYLVISKAFMSHSTVQNQKGNVSKGFTSTLIVKALCCTLHLTSPGTRTGLWALLYKLLRHFTLIGDFQICKFEVEE